MKRHAFALGGLMLMLLLGATVAGCGKQTESDGKPAADGKKPDVKVAKKGPLTPLKAEALDGVVKGRVVYDGTPPEMPYIKALEAHKDCMQGGEDFEKREQTWIVGKDKEVANVVVWLTPPDGNHFVLKDEDKNRTGQEVFLDQPHCVYVPHVVAVYPSYFDGKARTPTGQVFKVKNTAQFSHNSLWSGDTLAGNQGNQTIPSGGHAVLNIAYQKAPFNVSCNIHAWMVAKVWTFDHPYHAVTDRAGAFKMANVPTGVDLTLHAWHEGTGEFTTRTVKFNKGDNDLELKVKK